MVMVLEQQMVSQIARIGRERYPAEACGLMFPIPINGVQIVELPNRSKEQNDSFEMTGEDMYLAIEQAFRGDIPKNVDDMLPGLTAWHTHPSGHVGPSRFDLQNKPVMLKSLVVTLFDDGRPPVATWY